ncbi:MAG: sensor histidine kinase [Chloroflexota bacterium]
MEDRIRSICISVRKAVCNLMDVDRFYVIMANLDLMQVRFPLVWENDADLPENQEPWVERAWDKRWPPDSAILNNALVYLDAENRYWPEGEKVPKSWLVMPIGLEENLRMALVVENQRRGDAFGDEAERFLSTISQQMAMAIRDVRLTEEWQASELKRRAAERFAAVNRLSGEFAHSMNNLAGNIPVWINLAKDKLDVNDPQQQKVVYYLSEIEKSTQRLLGMAQEIREASHQRPRESLEIHKMIDIALKRAFSSQPFATDRIEIVRNFAENPSYIQAGRDDLLTTLTSIIRNGLEAMPERGTLTISTRVIQQSSRFWVEIGIQDTGIGIPSQLFGKIFEPFFTTKETGLGFGLWRDKALIEELGGQISVKSKEKVGSTFLIKLPTSQ